MLNSAKWTELDPKKKRLIVIAGVVFVVFVVMTVFDSEPNNEWKKRNRQESIKHVLTNKNSREAGMDALVANQKITKKEQDKQRRDIERLKKELEEAKKKTGASANFGKELEQLKLDLKELKRENKKLKREVGKSNKSKSNGKPSANSSGTDSSQNAQTSSSSGAMYYENLNPKDPSSFFKKAPIPDTKNGKPNGTDKGKKAGKPVNKAGVSIVSISQESESTDEQIEQPETKENKLYLPAGSILTGVTITGMDAPTSKGARKDPFPATIRIQKEAILPNRFRADVRECFLIVSGYGDLSSERAYLRGEVISCVREDGGVIESKLDGYAVGEDGKAGVRGRLVSKQGAMITRSLTAGFFGGFAKSLDSNPVPVINTNPLDNEPVYQNIFNKGTLQGGLSKGASSAMERIADFYLGMAEGMFPVIEVDAGRQIDIIITKGQELKLKSQGIK